MLFSGVLYAWSILKVPFKENFVFCRRDSPTCWYCGQSDCPYETAWGITDVNGNPKPAFYAIKDVMATFKK